MYYSLTIRVWWYWKCGLDDDPSREIERKRERWIDKECEREKGSCNYECTVVGCPLRLTFPRRRMWSPPSLYPSLPLSLSKIHHDLFIYFFTDDDLLFSHLTQQWFDSSLSPFLLTLFHSFQFVYHFPFLDFFTYFLPPFLLFLPLSLSSYNNFLLLFFPMKKGFLSPLFLPNSYQ